MNDVLPVHIGDLDLSNSVCRFSLQRPVIVERERRLLDWLTIPYQPNVVNGHGLPIEKGLGVFQRPAMAGACPVHHVDYSFCRTSSEDIHLQRGRTINLYRAFTARCQHTVDDFTKGCIRFPSVCSPKAHIHVVTDSITVVTFPQ